MGTLSDIEADWPRISALFDAAMSRPVGERDTFIESLTAPDDRFRDTLRELLALQAKVETEDFMEALPVFPGLLTERWAKQGDADTALPGPLAAGAEVGPYRLLILLGEGGMGAVWLAERADGTLKRKVALKLPRLAWAQDLAARMARERDILSALEHPNIARLYDAGVDGVGRPWLALEYVEGTDLASFCDTAQRDDAALREPRAGAGGGGRLTVASDIYSLGVVLHELLTDETPYALRRGTRAEYEQAIVESDLRVPSRTTVSAEAAAALREDLERWLDGRPVSAVPPSRTYALRKFVARNRVAVAASAAAALALVAVSVVALLQAQRAERSAAEARAEAGRSDATKDLVLSIIRDADADPTRRPGSGVRELVAAQLDARLTGQPELRDEILGQLLGVYAYEGDLAGAAAAAERISRAAFEQGDIDQAVKTLLEEAYYAIARDDHATARLKLDRIGAVVDVARPPASDRVAVHDLEALLADAVGDRVTAAARYDLMVASAREAGDDASLFAGLVSRMRARTTIDASAGWRGDLVEA